MKKVFNFKSLTLLLFLTLSIGQTWGGPTFSGGYAYFHNKGGWSDSYKQLCIGKSSYTETRTMTAIANTQLWYNSLPTSGWGDATYMAVMGNSSSWGSGSWGPSNLSNATHRTGTVNLGDWGFGSGNVNMLTPDNGNNDATLTLTYVGNAYSSLNLSQTFKVQVSTDGGTTYSAPATSPATISFSSKTFSNYTTCGTNSTGSLSGSTVSSSKNAGYTATTTLSISDVASGYVFVGWYDSSNNLLSNNTSYTYYPTAATEVRARFKNETTYTVNVALADASQSGGTTSPNGNVQVGATPVTITAPMPATGYASTGRWTATGGVTIANATANPTTITATSAGTVRWTFDEDLSSPWTLKGGTNLTGDNWTTAHALTKKTGHSAESVAYYTFSIGSTNSGQSDDPAASSWSFKLIKNGSTWYGLAADGSSYWWQRSTTANQSLSTSGANIQICADVAGDYEVKVDYSTSTPKITITFPTKYSVTHSVSPSGAANPITTSPNVTSGGYVAAGTSVTFTHAAANDGYTWYRWENGSGSSLGTGNTYSKTINANTTVVAKYTPKTYTVSFDNNGGTGDTPSPITVTFGSPYGTLPAGPTPPGVDQFAGWSTGASSGPIVTSSTIVSTASNHTLYARFESTYTVTVQYKCGTDVLRAQTTTHASETSVAAEIIAPEILGYAFVEWTGDNATFADPTSATTTVNVTSATTVVANYEVVPMVYFKNNLDWDEVYVSFDIGWTTVGGKQVPTNKNKPYYQMTQLGTSDIFYCVIPSTYTDNNYAGWKGNIAFDNTNYGGTATTTHSGTWNDFYEGEFLGRADFDPNATMYIPYDGDTETRNSGTYYPTGCWLQYNTNYAGYKVNVWNSVNGNSGEQVNYPGTELRSDVAGSFEFKAKVYVPYSPTAYGMKLYKDKLKNDNEKWYTNVNDAAHTITSETTTLPWSFTGAGSDENWQRCRFLPEVAGDYIFTVSFATGRPMVDIEYPVSVGDFRLVYKDRATWNTTHDASWKQISPVFKKSANRVDTASFFVSYGSSPTVELQKCTAVNPSTGAETWTKQGSDVSLSGITSKGVYNFKVTQNADASSATAAYAGAYTGKYYVRTDASDGGWNDYKSVANTMTYTEYSMTHGGSSGPYSYYFMRHVNEGQNIKFIVANDYSLCLTDTMIDDTYAHEWIECEANVRFTWNHTNNEIHRAYISGSSIISDRFLVLEGDSKLFDADGHALTGTYQVSGLNAYEMNFIDDQNWIYETTVQAQPLERVKLTAKFNNKIQYFYGAEGARTDATTHQLIGGTGSTKYKMRVVYDFKTNRLLAAWLPNGDISVPTKIEADVMIIRYHQEDAQQITFSSTGKLTDVKTVYGAMEFNKYRLNNQSETGGHGDLGLSPYERDLYFISFPFDVKLNDVFGFGTYGKHWIIEYYDGKGRAEKGYWIDSPTNWKFVTKAMRDSYTLKANTGYVLALDLDELTMESSVWNYGVENVYLYFPSTATVENIQATSATVEIDQEGYYCSINRGTPDGDRRVKDSYWHFLGVPSYANANHTTTNSWEAGTTYPVLDNVSPATWQSAAPYVYDWNATTNKFGVISASSMTFKPMKAYLAQYARDTLQWRQVNTTVAAPRRDASMPESYEFNLVMQQNGETIDQTFINLREDDDVTYDFDFNYDLSKMLYGAFTSTSNIYTFAGTEQVAANCLPLNDEQAVVQVGVTIAAEGEYTFAIPDGTNGVGVTLVDGMTGDRTNLALTNYQVSLESGTYDGRFTLEISPIVQVTTGIETLNSEKHESTVSGVSKKLIDGMLYIVKDGKVFDARGARVK